MIMCKASFTRLIAALVGGVVTTSTALAASDRAQDLAATALELDANAGRGATLYREQCASCHGPNAHGAAEHDIPALAAQCRAYIVKQLADFIEGDRVATQMHKVVSREAVRDAQALADVSLYLNNLPAPQNAETGDGKYPALGEASTCSCHEDDGRGDDDGFVPSVRIQHYRYLLKKMRNPATGHRFNIENDLSRFLSSLEGDEMQGLADYMSRMHEPLRDRSRMNDDGQRATKAGG